MSGRLLVSTRKGLFTVARETGEWSIAAVDFLGDNVTLAIADRRDGCCYAALDHGHFGVKLHRRTETEWEEITTPAYPPKPEGYEEKDLWGRPPELDDSAHMGTGARWGRGARRNLVRDTAGRAIPFGRRRPKLGNDAVAVGSSEA